MYKSEWKTCVHWEQFFSKINNTETENANDKLMKKSN